MYNLFMISFPIISLIFANLIPLFGVIFYGWDLSSLMVLYWFENVIIGFINVFKMQHVTVISDGNSNLRINGQPAENYPKIFLVGFFAIHYGIFTLVHGGFVFALFGLPDVSFFNFMLALVALFISHFISYHQNFIGKEEFKKTTVAKQMFSPYSRIVVLHVTVILSGMFIQNTFSDSARVMPILIFVSLKTLIDLVAHINEHKK